MASTYSVQTAALVRLTITSSVNSFGTEKRFEKDFTIGALKGKFELLTGSLQQNMLLTLYDRDNKKICSLDDDNALLGRYPVEDGMVIHVHDPTMTKGQNEDVSMVEKFEISKEEYEKRTDSVKAFKERMKIGRFKEVDPEEKKREEEEKAAKEKAEKDAVDAMKIGDRCEVRVNGQPTKRGTVMYTGEANFKPGLWVGIKYDEPLGKNDGSVQGKRYFECPAKYGGFVKPQNVHIGDYPEEDYGLDEDEM